MKPNENAAMNESDVRFMRAALEEARLAEPAGEVPVGAIIVLDGEIIGRGSNRSIADHDPTAHAEIVAIRQAAMHLKNYRLTGATLYVTVEPCSMCAGAAVLARVARLIYGCHDIKAGAVRSLYQIADDARLNHRIEILSGVLEEECAALLRSFFQAKRASG